MTNLEYFKLPDIDQFRDEIEIEVPCLQLFPSARQASITTVGRDDGAVVFQLLIDGHPVAYDQRMLWNLFVDLCHRVYRDCYGKPLPP